MIPPIYLQDYKVESKEGNVNYSVVGALPNEIPGVETKQFTWNFVSHMVLDKCSRFIRIKYHFKDTKFQKAITFHDKLMGTIQLGSKVYNAGDIMKYKYNKELLEMELIILFPLEEKICGKDLSWNIFINDTLSCSLPVYTTTLTYNTDDTTESNNWTWENNKLVVTGSNKNYSRYRFTITNVPSGKDIIPDMTDLSKLGKECYFKHPSVVITTKE